MKNVVVIKVLMSLAAIACLVATISIILFAVAEVEIPYFWFIKVGKFNLIDFVLWTGLLILVILGINIAKEEIMKEGVDLAVSSTVAMFMWFLAEKEVVDFNLCLWLIYALVLWNLLFTANFVSTKFKTFSVTKISSGQ